MKSACGERNGRSVTRVRRSEVTTGHRIQREAGNQGKNLGRKRYA